MRSFPPWLFGLLLLTTLLVGCSDADHASPTQQPRTFTDDLDRTVSLTPPIERVVTLAPNLTEMVFAAGAGSTLVGVTTADDYPPAVDTLPRFGALPVDFEAIAALDPDLVLATDQVNNPRDAETFAALGIPIAFLSFQGVLDVLDGIRTVGTLLGTERQANRTADSLNAQIEWLRRTTDDLDERPLTLFLIDDETSFSFGHQSYIHDLIALAGGRSATADLATNAPILSDEFVLTKKPDVIIGTFGTAYDPQRLLAHHPTWDVVPAVQNERVYSLDGDLLLRPGPRLVEGTQQMARMLHPDLFAPAEAATASTPSR